MQKVLVIEKPGPARTDLVGYLVSEDFLVETADDGISGVSAGREHRPDAIVCRWEVDGPNGHQVLEAVRQDGELALTPFVMITDNSDRAHCRLAMSMGADDCLVRPCTHAEIRDTLAARIRRQTATSELYVATLRHTAEQINRLAHYDRLTDLPNYHLLHQKLTQFIAASHASQQTLAFMSLSLDRLRTVNTVMGYPSGDNLLRSAAHRLKSCLPPEATLARLTANQFAIVLPNLKRHQQANETAEDLMDALKRPFSLPGGQEIFVTTSIGVAFLLHQSEDVQTLLRQADAALEYAKKQKSNYCQFYRSDMPVVLSDQIQMETQLRYGLERDEFEVHYQPQLNLASGNIEGCEALIRWRHPERGYISPIKFVPLAEETGLIVPIGQWVLETACVQAKRWQEQNLGMRYISVNISSVQFNQTDLIDSIKNTLASSGLAPQQLELEVTETALMQDAESAIAILTELKALGIRIAIDDFGTGYSSLSYLKQLPIDTLKIDNCFVRGATKDPKNQAILQSTIELAHRLNLSVVAEGVENQEELLLLSQYQCDFLQGYWVGRPMSHTDIEKKLAPTVKLQPSLV
ncbi:MAG: GGDEF domain-containing response regulator [Leptolyngbya foveolarum]|uniref:GGDEF domain-containing response regulator n=1 Tax=Leptolyngbya foveolarum TaxID=47253 RepID=A0A2W4UTL7_9CYAN|nr:MAG: GGDEF domain-containing response regulator [Leptolyngbya foveolarum]